MGNEGGGQSVILSRRPALYGIYVTESMRKDAYDTMIDITNSMDYGMMESLLDDIDNYKLEKEDSERFKRIRKLLLELDWEGIEAELKTVQ